MVKEAQKLLERHDPQFHQWKEEAEKKDKAVEVQEQAEVLAKFTKEQFDQTMNALSPSLLTPPPFPPSPPGVPNLPLAAEERRGPNDLLGAPQLRWIEAELLHKVSFGRNGVTRDKLLGSTSGTAGSWRPWASSLLVMVVEQPSPERKRRGQTWCLTLHANNELSCPPLQVFGRPWAWSWYVDYSFFLGLYLGHLSVSKPCPYLSVLQSYWNLHVWNRKKALFLVDRVHK